jgi:hypothetical protein
MISQHGLDGSGFDFVLIVTPALCADAQGALWENTPLWFVNSADKDAFAFGFGAALGLSVSNYEPMDDNFLRSRGGSSASTLICLFLSSIDIGFFFKKFMQPLASRRSHNGHGYTIPWITEF